MSLALLRQLIQEFVDHKSFKDVAAEFKSNTVKVTDSRSDQINLKFTDISMNGNAVKAFLKRIDARLQPMGWFVAETSRVGAGVSTTGKADALVVRLQPITGDVANIHDRLLYHVTTKDRAEQIKSSGMVPQTSQEKVRYAPRLYFATTPKATVDVAKDLATRFMKAGGFSILVFTKPDGVEFYKDPEFGSKDEFVYTTEAVPASNIVDVIDIDLSKVRHWQEIGTLVQSALR